jgi:hypothetical protein
MCLANFEDDNNLRGLRPLSFQEYNLISRCGVKLGFQVAKYNLICRNFKTHSTSINFILFISIKFLPSQGGFSTLVLHYWVMLHALCNLSTQCGHLRIMFSIGEWT